MTRTATIIPRFTSKLNVWRIAYAVILILALVTRLYALGDRATSHDETTHAKYAWNLYSGRGFRHDPLMHGPLLFEVSALFYFLFGVSDFSARLYAALAGVILVLSPWLLRKWLGRLGALFASVMLLISPSIAYYSRYTRHDIPLLVGTVLFLWAILKYFDDGRVRWLRWMAGAFAFLYVTKENAYMLTAIFGALLALIFLWRVLSTPWAHPHLIRTVLLLLVVAILTGGLFGLSFRAAQSQEEGEGNTDIGDVSIPIWGRVFLGAALSSLVAALVLTARGIGAVQVARMRVFDVLMVIGTLTLPLSSAFLMRFVVDLDMTTFYGALMSANLTTLPTGEAVGAVLALLVCWGVAVGLGLWWNRRQWPILAVICYGIFFIFYSTFFTWGWGMVTGLVGGLAYWMAQQAVERGSQPWFYYLMVGSLYEYFPLLLSVGAGLTVGVGALAASGAERRQVDRAHTWIDASDLMDRLFPLFVIGWAILSWIAYIVAGEKMPWLFVHIAFPHILLAAWALDRWFGDLSWEDLGSRARWLVPVGLFFLLLAWIALRQSSGALSQILEPRQAGEGLTLTLAQLQPLGKLMGGGIGLVSFGGLVIWALSRQPLKHALQLIVMAGVLILGGLTVRTMVMLNYINDELAKEYMVYAHATPDVNRALDEIERVSWRTTGSPDQVQVAYGQEVAWPFYWYMDSQYPNNYYFVVQSDPEGTPSPDPERLLESPVILAASAEWEAVEAIVGDEYTITEYNHIWWPVEHYKQLTWSRLREIVSDPAMRAALWDIIVWRDYTQYARLHNPEAPFTLQDWPHRMEFRLYVRKSVKSGIGGYRLEDGGVVYGDAAPPEPQVDDPFSQRTVERAAEWRAPMAGARGRGLAYADGMLYVADPATHQIWSVSDAGEIVDRWGGYGAAPGGFNAPWDVAVGAEGSLYVADTWNHRVQVLSLQGQPVRRWGRLAQVRGNDASTFGAFYGPRSVAVSPDGDVYVADTGNDRVQVFDAEGTFLRWIGENGANIGQFNEPVGLAVGDAGELYVADAWNARIQVLDAAGQFVRSWAVPSWQRLGPRDKPFLAYADDRVWATDPALGRVLAFTAQGIPDLALVDPEVPLVPAGLTVAGKVLYVTLPQTGEVVAYAIPGGNGGGP